MNRQRERERIDGEREREMESIEGERERERGLREKKVLSGRGKEEKIYLWPFPRLKGPLAQINLMGMLLLSLCLYTGLVTGGKATQHHHCLSVPIDNSLCRAG